MPTPLDEKLARAGEKAAVLAEALPWLQRFHGQVVVVKYGGNAMCVPYRRNEERFPHTRRSNRSYHRQNLPA